MSDHPSRERTALIAGLLAAAGAVLAAAAYVWWKINRLPAEHPAAAPIEGYRAAGRRVVVCAGDSLTHGTASADYVNLLRGRYGHAFAFVNAGINGDLAWNLLQRLDEIIALAPDEITILIGTNDANAALLEQRARFYVRYKQLPIWPSLHWYERTLRAIVQRLKAETTARIAVISPPVMWEEYPGGVNEHLRAYVNAARRIATEEGINYIPLFEEQLSTLADLPTADGRPPALALFRHHLLGESWGSISKTGGYHLLSDGIHLNEDAARQLADLISAWLARKP